MAFDGIPYDDDWLVMWQSLNTGRILKQSGVTLGLPTVIVAFGVAYVWDRLLPTPISVPDGQPLITLRDSDKLIQHSPKADALSPEWQIAIETLLLAAEDCAPSTHAEVGLRKALRRQYPIYDTSP